MTATKLPPRGPEPASPLPLRESPAENIYAEGVILDAHGIRRGLVSNPRDRRTIVHRVNHWDALHVAAEQLRRERDEALAEVGWLTALLDNLRDQRDGAHRQLGEVADMLPHADWTPGECTHAEAVLRVVAERNGLRAEVERLRETVRGIADRHGILPGGAGAATFTGTWVASRHPELFPKEPQP